jgi:hypothetical protein
MPWRASERKPAMASKRTEGAPFLTEKSPRGRPSKLTDAIQDKILQTLKLCGTLEDAAAAAGIALGTLHQWKSKGLRQTKGRYRDFVDAVWQAENERRITRELHIIRSGQDHMVGQDKDGKGGVLSRGDWRATAWILERTDPKRYAPRVYQHVDQELDDAIRRIKEAFSDDPAGLERALTALAGGQSRDGIGDAEDLPDRADDAGGEAVLPTPPEPETKASA